MTVCIAALSEPLNAIVTVSDTMLSTETDSMDGAVTKLLPLFSRWACLHDGDGTVAEELRSHISASLAARNMAKRVPYAEMVSCVEAAYAAMLDHRVDVEILPRYGTNRQKFDDGMRNLGPAKFKPITDAIAELVEKVRYDDPTSLLVCGFDDHMKPWIFSSDGVGYCSHHGYGHHALGTGAPAALAWLKSSGAPALGDSVTKIAYRLCEAKFASETARTAGPTTFIGAFTGGGAVNVMTLPPPDQGPEPIRDAWKTRLRQPIDTGAIAKLEEGLSDRPPSRTVALRYLSLRRQVEGEGERMKRRTSIPILASIILALALAGCQTTTGSSDALTQAKLAYVDASIAYEGAQQAITLARSRHQITDAQWASFEVAQHQVATIAPTVSATLRRWSATGIKPAAWDEELAAFLGLVAQATTQSQQATTGGH